MKDQTSWQNVGKWYNETVGKDGHYYHQTLIIPKVLHLLQIPENEPSSLLDLACGQGILSRKLPKKTLYVGVDNAASLLAAAKEYTNSPLHKFILHDLTKPLSIPQAPFSHATIILALQNIAEPLAVFKNAYQLLQKNAPLVIVLNHPCFRIPRQSSWKVDEEQKIQYRRIDRYMSPMKIPIQMHPGKGSTSPNTFSFHHPISDYTRWLAETGFTIELIEEWVSDKVSQGGSAKMENRCREEFPLFMTLLTRKK